MDRWRKKFSPKEDQDDLEFWEQLKEEYLQENPTHWGMFNNTDGCDQGYTQDISQLFTSHRNDKPYNGIHRPPEQVHCAPLKGKFILVIHSYKNCSKSSEKKQK